MMRNIIFDCDPGHDDAIALVLALASRELNLMAVTTVGGNNTVENTTQNALKVLELCGRSDIPVARGSAKPMTQPLTISIGVHGKTGMDGPVLPTPTARPHEKGAVELMGELVAQSETPVTLVVTGPFTNVGVFCAVLPAPEGEN